MMMASRSPMLAVAAVLALSVLTGCDKKPGGQVVAVVNSEEITQQELRAEAEAAGIAPGQDPQSAMPALLDRTIERNLLANSARKQGLDRGPDYVARRRQLEQSLLANLALRKLSTAVATPSPAEVQAFIAANPATFANRQRLKLDQVRFRTPSDVAQIKALTTLGSLAAIESKLRADGVQSARGVTVLDTGQVETTVAKQVAVLPDGQIFDLSTGGITYISAIIGRSLAATPSASWTQPATAGFQRERTAKMLVDAMKKLKAEAKIEYDPAFKPAAVAK